MLDREFSELSLLRDVSKCSFCGFCEWVCPTLKGTETRLNGPRGRVNIIALALKEGVWTEMGLNSIYGCLVCGACNTQCPAGIKIAEDIRAFRYYLKLRGFKPIPLTKQEAVSVHG